jgi:hypothetical protein
MSQVLEGLTERQFNASVPEQVQELYNAEAGAYVLKADDLRKWAYVMLKYPTLTKNGYKVRVSLAVKDEAGKWYNLDTGLTKAETILESGFLSKTEAEQAMEWVVENGTEEGNKHARLRLLASEDKTYVAFSLRVNRKPGEKGQQGELAANPVAIKQLCMFGLTIERESAVISSFNLGLPIPSKITLSNKPEIKQVEDLEVTEVEEAQEVTSNKKQTFAKAISF